jgi:hypothetical protein
VGYFEIVPLDSLIFSFIVLKHSRLQCAAAALDRMAARCKDFGMAAEGEKLTFSEWCEYAGEAWRQARSEINYAAFFRALAGPAIFWAVQMNSNFIKQHQPLVMLLLTLGSAIAVFILEFLFRLLLWAPAKLLKKVETDHKEAANLHDEQVALHAREKADLQGQLDAMQMEKNERPKLSIRLITGAVLLSKKNQQWQALVEVQNISKNKDIDNVELLIDSVIPDSGIKSVTFPCEVELAATGFGLQIKTYMAKQLKPSHSVRFAVITGTSNTFWLGIRMQGNPLDIMNSGKISIALKASGSMVEPSLALLTLTGSGERESTLGLTLSRCQ